MPTPRAVGPAAMAAAIVLLAALLYACGYREQYYALAEIWAPPHSARRSLTCKG